MDSAFPSERGQSFDSYSGDSYGRPQRRGFRGTAENAKTKLCMRWLAGDCRFGPRCNFAHGEHELRKLPPKNPGRFSQDAARDRDREKDRRNSGPRGYYGSVSFDAGYNRPVAARPSIYDDYYNRSPYNSGYANGSSPYNRVYPAPGPGPAPNGGYAPMGPGRGPPGPGPAGPMHVAAHSPNTAHRDYYASHGYPVAGPNGWTMYRDPESGEPYYHNHHTNVTQWNKPPEFQAS